MAFLNAPACAGKEVNAKVTENDALSMRVDLKNADRSIQNLVFCTVEYLLLGPHDRE